MCESLHCVHPADDCGCDCARAERKELQDITEMAAELPANINKYYTTSSLLLTN